MRSVGAPAHTPITIYDGIQQAKRGARSQTLQQLRARIINSYGNYQAGNLGTLTTLVFSKDDKEVLLHAYTSETKPLAILRQSLMAAAGQCPFCGLGPSGTLDHYLPKEIFPEFSVHCQNLIPCCDPCNRLKGTIVPTNGMRKFLHAYFDSIPANALCLKATPKCVGNTLQFTFSMQYNAAISPNLYSVLSSHVENLNLLERYRVAVGEELTDNVEKTSGSGGLSANKLKDLIQTNIHKKRGREGALSWRAALWEGLLTDQSAFDFYYTVYY